MQPLRMPRIELHRHIVCGMVLINIGLLRRQGQHWVPWFRVDDGFHSHPKRLSVSLAAVGLWTVAGSWSSAHLTDGAVPDNVLPLLSPDAPMLAGELVAAGLWKRRKGGYQFHDWQARNPSKQAVENERKNNAERQKRWREAHGNGDRNAVTNGVTNDVPALTQPIDKPKKTTSSSVARSRASRIPEDFAVTPEMVTWARQNVPDVDGRRETERFIDHWHQASGTTARKRDWPAAWRNWMREADDRLGRRQRASPQKPTTNDRVQQAIEAGKRVQAMMSGGS